MIKVGNTSLSEPLLVSRQFAQLAFFIQNGHSSILETSDTSEFDSAGTVRNSWLRLRSDEPSPTTRRAVLPSSYQLLIDLADFA